MHKAIYLYALLYKTRAITEGDKYPRYSVIQFMFCSKCVHKNQPRATIKNSNANEGRAVELCGGIIKYIRKKC